MTSIVFGAQHGTSELEDARESLAYWEERARTLPRSAVRRRREARAMARRWQERVAAAERDVYGRGLLGALVLLVAERRLPQPTRHAAHTLARRASQAVVAVVAAVVLLVAASAVWALEVLVDVLRALG